MFLTSWQNFSSNFQNFFYRVFLPPRRWLPFFRHFYSTFILYNHFFSSVKGGQTLFPKRMGPWPDKPPTWHYNIQTTLRW